MCKIIAIANQKGGVAKTTTTINLGVGLSKVGKRVMLIDADPQGHLTMGLGFPKNLRVTLKTMMENIIMGLEFDPREAILHHEEGIDVIPSNKLLSGMDMSLFTVEDREKVLKEYLELLENDYDYILIDCMPSLGMMTINALSAADSVLIPVQPQYYAADGLMELLKVVKGMTSWNWIWLVTGKLHCLSLFQIPMIPLILLFLLCTHSFLICSVTELMMYMEADFQFM